MKNIFLLLVLVLSLAACKKSERPDPGPKDPLPPELKTDSSAVTIAGTADALDSFAITFSGKWEIKINPSTATWVALSKSSGTGNAKIYVTAHQTNTTATPRSAILSVIPDGNTAKQVIITINQYPQPAQTWSKVYGGTKTEMFYTQIATRDSGYIAVGSAQSSDGDVIVNKGEDDLWIVRIDKKGDKVWQKSYGGSAYERGTMIIRTVDNGYIIVGSAYSNDGDVSGNHGKGDAWVLKIDSSGNKMWQKTFGGSELDYATSVVPTSDGGYLIQATTLSNDGDVSGRTATGLYNFDYWVIKMDADGNKVWNKTYGGTQSDIGSKIIAANGNYVIAGSTGSNDLNVSGNRGMYDALLIKIDPNGAVIWSKTYGGSRVDDATSIVGTADGGYVFAGSTNSNDGDISGLHGKIDFWAVKIDASGNKLWQKTFGGAADDYIQSLEADSDGGYLLAGFTSSNDGDVSGNHGGQDAWIIKLDGSGSKMWQRTFGGTANDQAAYVIKGAEEGYVLGGLTKSNDGDILGNHGEFDAWLLKFQN